MKVYILSAGYQYEGLEIIEVFDSEEKAKNFCNYLIAVNRNGMYKAFIKHFKRRKILLCICQNVEKAIGQAAAKR